MTQALGFAAGACLAVAPCDRGAEADAFGCALIGAELDSAITASETTAATNDGRINPLIKAS